MLAGFASRQYGVVARRQAIDAGVPSHVIDQRVKQGRLKVLHPGVYRLGPIVGSREREMAALLVCGEGAVLSHESAAAVWRLLPAALDPGSVDVIVRIEKRVRVGGVCAHRAILGRDEATRHLDLPITTPARTLLDVAGRIEVRELERAFARASRDGLIEGDVVAELLARHPRRRGAGVLRALLSDPDHASLTRSAAEESFVSLIRKSGLPPPAANVVVHGHEVDFYWRAAGLIVEVDGFAFHGSAAAFERDRGRDARLAAAGLRVMRVTWRQLNRQPEALLVRVGQALARTSRT